MDKRGMNSAPVPVPRPLYEYSAELAGSEFFYDTSQPPVADSSQSPKRKRDCVFLKRVVKECYEGRFYARVLEFYFIETHEEPPPFDRCLMCDEGGFKDKIQMLRHLKACPNFSRGRFECPDCDTYHEFSTVSKRWCSWDRKRLRQKLVKTLRKSMKVVTSLARSRSSSTLILRCPCCGSYHQPLDLEKFASRASKKLDPLELANTARAELGSACTDMFSELDSSPTSKTNPLHSPTSPAGISSASDSHVNTFLDVSSISSNESPGSSPDVGTYRQATSTKRYQYTTSAQTGPHGYLHSPGMSFDYDITNVLQRRSTPSYSPPNLVENHWDGAATVPSSFRPSAIPSLSINTEHIQSGSTMPNFSSAWPVFDNTATPAAGPPPYPAQSLPDRSSFGIGLNRFHPAAIGPASSNVSPMISGGSSSGSGNPDSLNDNLQCPFDGFRPTGKREYLKAYFRKHMKTHEAAQHYCPYCLKPFTRLDNCSKHIKTVHPDSSQSPPKRRRDSTDSTEHPEQQRMKTNFYS